ncbi:hypothetical protein LEMA_P032730.1 [Plenodomus lingam JN3]|uniref:Vacuolar membrane protease n=1 Tax=Leptosphaeria maculans (strain JN3 / isolate v23.1.3 / race Av1-4-5-6-7-8) TaxID=985895 RepID=PFF1_LEPMJ|nr:hypothetical protein LEMA_P032730.1 [Plenodomus lingam JN3]E4ZQC4.1 RecName: Full=Vacuolar membrane protease; AltName: Full=FXNA-related family protease 1 [Plenodomus lingam JN3]CBX93599.1 hypothetical protein LEMA_P032730.1 [Plenodomus lingam JN3]
MARYNPLAFTSGPVVFFITITYTALLIALLLTHLTLPSYPSHPPLGINLTQAWSDLEHITREFHPYNSHANDNVRAYLLSRIEHMMASKKLGSDQVQIIDDNISNATFSSGNTTVYFEGTNLIVAVRGSHDDQAFNDRNRRPDNGGVLVNAHYDSVSSGYGATDDGVGVVSVLQLLSFFTEPKNWPKRTVVLLLNNGEEDFLNGAKAFMRHDISQVPHTFVNLEGAGAGGRAAMFRSTDTHVTRFYRKSEHPFGTVVSGDGFKKGLVRSETDYKVFFEELGLAGLDIAFIEPRAKYHTIEDSTRETSLNSVWHMLSAAIATTSGLAADTSTPDRESHDDAVWFDIFGKVFIVFQLHTFFALCVTLLVVAPLTLIGLAWSLHKADRNYLFARKAFVYSADDDEPIHLYGWRGFFRFPIAFGIATSIVVGLAMMLSAWFAVSWFLLHGADAMRPSALQRMYSLLWLFIGSFCLLVFFTILANNHQVAAGYPSLFCFATVFLANVLSFLELFLAPPKSAYAWNVHQNADGGSRPLTSSATAARSDNRATTDDDATETTSLLSGNRRSFARHDAGRRDAINEGANSQEPESRRRLDLGQPHSGEQEWSGKLPSWIWIVQFSLLAPMIVILVGQIALLLTSALYQTPSDGNSPLYIYTSIAALAVFLVAPIGPFIHRFTHHVPTFLFLLCVATTIYNLVAFPFSEQHKLKVYFVQRVDCDTGVNTVSLTGLDGYVQRIAGNMPSAQQSSLNCSTPDIVTRKELRMCEWEGLHPNVVSPTSQYSNKTRATDWIDYEIFHDDSNNRGRR